MPTVNIQPNKRYSFIGMTRSGKSFLAWFFLRMFSSKDKKRQIVFIDPKHEHKKFGDGTTLDRPKLVKKYDPKVQFQIFQEYTWGPELENLVDELLKLSDGKNKLFNSAIVVLDELGGLATATSVPMGIQRLWTQGGGKNVGAWAMMQRSKGYPKVIKSQTELFFMFKIGSKSERQDLLDVIPDPQIVTKVLKPHYFFLFSNDMTKAILCKPIEVPDSQKPK